MKEIGPGGVSSTPRIRQCILCLCSNIQTFFSTYPTLPIIANYNILQYMFWGRGPNSNHLSSKTRSEVMEDLWNGEAEKTVIESIIGLTWTCVHPLRRMRSMSLNMVWTSSTWILTMSQNPTKSLGMMGNGSASSRSYKHRKHGEPLFYGHRIGRLQTSIQLMGL